MYTNEKMKDRMQKRKESLGRMNNTRQSKQALKYKASEIRNVVRPRKDGQILYLQREQENT